MVQSCSADTDDEHLEDLLPAFIRNSVMSKRPPASNMLVPQRNTGIVSTSGMCIRVLQCGVFLLNLPTSSQQNPVPGHAFSCLRLQILQNQYALCFLLLLDLLRHLIMQHIVSIFWSPNPLVCYVPFYPLQSFFYFITTSSMGVICFCIFNYWILFLVGENWVWWLRRQNQIHSACILS